MKDKDWWRYLTAEAVTARVTCAATAIYPPPEWATFHEVPIPAIPISELDLVSGDRYFGERRVDILAVHCWTKTPGAVLDAVEVKASRADLFRELGDPHKGGAVDRIGARRWLAHPTGLATLDEVPACWGVITVDEHGKARRAREAPPPVERDLRWAVLTAIARRQVKDELPAGVVTPLGNEKGGQAWKALWKVGGRTLTISEIAEIAQASYKGALWQRHDTAATAAFGRYRLALDRLKRFVSYNARFHRAPGGDTPEHWIDTLATAWEELDRWRDALAAAGFAGDSPDTFRQKVSTLSAEVQELRAATLRNLATS
jgi:hypothetical protein